MTKVLHVPDDALKLLCGGAIDVGIPAQRLDDVEQVHATPVVQCIQVCDRVRQRLVDLRLADVCFCCRNLCVGEVDAVEGQRKEQQPCRSREQFGLVSVHPWQAVYVDICRNAEISEEVQSCIVPGNRADQSRNQRIEVCG